jgi:signal transduction histidine kinase
MNLSPFFVICTRDPLLRQRLDGYLRLRGQVTTAETAEEAANHLKSRETSVLLIDLRNAGALPLLNELPAEYPSCVAIALAEPKSLPAIEAGRLSIFSLLPLEPERESLQHLALAAFEQASLKAELRLIKLQRKTRDPGPAAPNQVLLSHLHHSFQLLGNPEDLLNDIVNYTARHFSAASGGLFLQGSDGLFHLHTGFRLRDNIQKLRFESTHPFVTHLRDHPHALVLGCLKDNGGENNALFLIENLHSMGAEILLPLYHGFSLLGWMVLGRHAVGRDYTEEEVQSLVQLAEPLSEAVHNSLLHQQTRLKQSLLETLLNSLPCGILFVSPEMSVIWANDKSLDLLGLEFDAWQGLAIDRIGSEFSDLARQAVNDSNVLSPQHLRYARTGRLLRLTPFRKTDQNRLLGIVLLLEDVTGAEYLRQQENKLLRSEMLAELAADMSFDIRTPLTAIKTFAQLLPERQGDTEFVESFGSLVTQEVERLSSIGDSLNLVSRLNSGQKASAGTFPIATAVELAMQIFRGGARFELIQDPQLPEISGSKERLAEGLAYLLMNSVEMLGLNGGPDDKLTITCRNLLTDASNHAIYIGIQGDHSAQGKKKALPDPGMINKQDLRLSLAAQVIQDFRGTLNIERKEKGAFFSVILPLKENIP